MDILTHVSVRVRMFFCACCLCLVFAGQAAGQSPRMELGRRLQRFEKAWELATPTDRAECVSPLKTAVSSFFSLRLSEAGRQLDAAWQTARGLEMPSDFEQSVVGLQLAAQPVCADTEQQSLSIQLRPFYETAMQPPPETMVLLRLQDGSGALLAKSSFALSMLLSSAEWITGKLPEGDHRLSIEFQSGAESFVIPDVTISRIAGFSERLAALQKSSDTANGSSDPAAATVVTVPPTVKATLRSTATFLKSLADARSQETDFPALARLELCEELASEEAVVSEVISRRGQLQDLWLTLATERRSVAVRIRCPEPTPAPLPVLFVFHGAGGSENMFFEAYGAGRVIQEAEKRGWLVVAPGQGILGLALGVKEMLEALESCFSIDRNRVMLLGHSMGAAQVMRQMQLHPEIPGAAVALGGGGRMPVADVKRFAATPWFIAAGEEDFGRPGAMQLHQSLLEAGGNSRYRDYGDVEHLVIVQAAIDDAFRFLETTISNR